VDWWPGGQVAMHRLREEFLACPSTLCASPSSPSHPPGVTDCDRNRRPSPSFSNARQPGPWVIECPAHVTYRRALMARGSCI
jgi:hypothetical protein